MLLSFIISMANDDTNMLKQCINHISSTFPHAEVIILDYNKSKNMKKQMISYTEEIEVIHSFPEVIEKVMTDNTSGEYLYFMNSDDKIGIKSLGKIEKIIKEHPSDIYIFNNEDPDNVQENDEVRQIKVENYPMPLPLNRTIIHKRVIERSKNKFSKNKYTKTCLLMDMLMTESITTIPLTNLETKAEKNNATSYIRNIEKLKEITGMLISYKAPDSHYDKIYTYYQQLKNMSIPPLNKEEHEKLDKEINNTLKILDETPTSHEKNKLKPILGNILDETCNQRWEGNIKVSIIVPTYNVEKYLDECMTSLIKQSLKEIEIIIVDDCSTDRTLDIIKYYQQKDERIHLIEQNERTGPGGCRNRGLQKARGKYVLYVDSDDWINLNTARKLYDTAEENKTQMLMFKGINYDEKEKRFYKTDYYSLKNLSDYQYKMFNVFDTKTGPFYINVTPWNKLYSRTFLERIKAKFPEKLIHQDNTFFLETFLQAEKVYMINEYLYNRRRRNNSITTLDNYRKFDLLEIAEKDLQVFRETDLLEEFNVNNHLILMFKKCYDEISNQYHKEYFYKAREKLFKIMEEYNIEEDFRERLSRPHKKFYDALTNSGDYDEFKKKAYDK